ncbi:MAG: hypothetical protein B5M53_00485 [Candidatus Cloacimonas sp. 4484_209]|nr:MAG: hypothetical protein B5M53_00485 [Candidatus Cloacimonas sp. 4484_209]
MVKDERLDFWVFLETFLKWWRIIVFNVLTITLLTIIISLLLPKKWTATAIILPPTLSSNSLNIEDVGSIYNLSSMALSAMPGIISPSDIVSGIMQSETIMRHIIDRFDIMKHYRIKTLDDAFKKMKKIIHISVTQDQMVKIEVTTEDPEYSAEIANALVEEVDKFNREVLMTTGKQFRIFLGNRLKEAEDELRSAAESLKVFQEKYKIFSLDIETKKSLELLATLQGQIVAKKVQVNALRSYSYKNNPQILKLKKDISALEKQLKEIEYGTPVKSKLKSRKDFGVGFSVPLNDVPDVGFKLTQLEMNLEVKKTVYSLLAEQYEKAKILESKDTPTITVLDKARPPDLRSFPKRKKLVVIAFIISIIYGFFIAIVCEGLDRITRDHRKYSRLFMLIDTFLAEIKPFLKKFRIKK